MVALRGENIRKGFPSSIFIIGAQKADTTFLADMLGQHPEVILANLKEPGYFAGKYNKGKEWYKSCFVNSKDNLDGRILLDAITFNTMAPLSWCEDIDKYSKPLIKVAQRIHEHSSDAKLIYVLRNPSAKTYSAYWNNVCARHEGRSFREAIHESNVYLRTSDYTAQLQLYYHYFPINQVEVILFDELIYSPLKVYAQCCRFFRISESFVPDVERKKSKLCV